MQYNYILTKENILDWDGLESIINLDLNSMDTYDYDRVSSLIGVKFTSVVALLLKEYHPAFDIMTIQDGLKSYVQNLKVIDGNLSMTYRNQLHKSNTVPVDDSTVFFKEMYAVDFKVLLMRLKNYLMHNTYSIDRVMKYVDEVKNMQMF